jgi:hypothetical protein
MGLEVLVKHNLITKIIAEETGGGGRRICVVRKNRVNNFRELNNHHRILNIRGVTHTHRG